MSLERLELTPFPTLLGEMITERKTGFLTVHAGGARRNIYASLGEIVMVTSDALEDSLADYLVRKGLVEPEAGRQLAEKNPVDLVLHFHDMELSTPASRQSLLREWVASIIVPLFTFDQGTASFTSDEPLDPDQRVFVSTPALVLAGVREITNGLILRRSLGDLKREISQDAEPRFTLERLPLLDDERKIAESLTEPKTIEAFLREFQGDSLTTARVVIALLTLGVYGVLEPSDARNRDAVDDEQTHKDLQLLAVLGPGDARSLHAVAFARQLSQFDLYRVLDVPRAALRAQIVKRVEDMKREYDPKGYPAVTREYIDLIHRKVDEAARILSDVNRRSEYDKMLAASRRDDSVSIQQRLTRRSIAEQNFRRSQDLSVSGDYWGAIVLLRQAVKFAPDHAQAWYLLGTCLEQNPQWKRETVEAYQRALSLDPNMVDAMLSLGDLYRGQGMVSRAVACYEDALQIAPDNSLAKTRLKNLGKSRK